MVVIKHSYEPLDRLVERLEHSGMEWDEITAIDGEPIPPADEIGVLVMTGGRMGAYETDAYPYLAEEMKLARELVERDVPVLGICLGSQLLAAALGGRVYKADRPEVGAVPLELTDAGHRHPVVSKVAGRSVFEMHQDTFDLPPGSALLARSDRFPQAFALGSALAIQFHPETHIATANRWANHGARAMVERAGSTPEEFAEGMEDARSDLNEGSYQLFDAWIAGLGD
jgi:GMP synthase (glutamine-hydrolysing)